MAGGLLASDPKRGGAKRGPREVVEKFSEPDSEGTVSKSAGWLARSLLRGCFVETEEILVLVNMGIQSENLVRWRVAPCAVTPLLRGWRGRARSMNVYVREEEWEGVIREVVGGKTAEPNAH